MGTASPPVPHESGGFKMASRADLALVVAHVSRRLQQHGFFCAPSLIRSEQARRVCKGNSGVTANLGSRVLWCGAQI